MLDPPSRRYCNLKNFSTDRTITFSHGPPHPCPQMNDMHLVMISLQKIASRSPTTRMDKRTRMDFHKTSFLQFLSGVEIRQQLLLDCHEEIATEFAAHQCSSKSGPWLLQAPGGYDDETWDNRVKNVYGLHTGPRMDSCISSAPKQRKKKNWLGCCSQSQTVLSPSPFSAGQVQRSKWSSTGECHIC